MDFQFKNEYLTNFKAKTVSLFKQGFRSLYVTTLNNNTNKKVLLKEYQHTVSNIPQWNSVIIENEYDRFIQGTKCNWLGDLIMAVFKATTKELMIFKNIDPDMDVHIPAPKVFIHACYIEIARFVWKKPQLLYHNYNQLNIIKNDDDLESVIKQGIDITFNKYLPFETIVSNYIKTNSLANNDQHDDNELTDDDNDSESTEDNDGQIITDEVIEDNGGQINTGQIITDENEPIEDSSDEVIEDGSDEVIEDNGYKIITDENEPIEDRSQIITGQNITDENADNGCQINNEQINNEQINNEQINNEQINTDENEPIEDRRQINTEQIITGQIITDENEHIEDIQTINNNKPSQINTDERIENDMKRVDEALLDDEINRSIKEVYIRDKHRRNENKIRKVLCIKVDYEILKKHPKKIRNYLLMENNKKWV
jgi:hypothetical protein